MEMWYISYTTYTNFAKRYYSVTQFFKEESYMSIVQALLIALVAAVARCEGDWLGECKLREPIITGFLVGLV